jgi:hypothetical protein
MELHRPNLVRNVIPLSGDAGSSQLADFAGELGEAFVTCRPDYGNAVSGPHIQLIHDRTVGRPPSARAASKAGRVGLVFEFAKLREFDEARCIGHWIAREMGLKTRLT